LIGIAVARAGNVIGGGDWAENRVVPDLIKAWAAKQTLSIRNPYATRPWQHVLEPLGGYLLLASKLKLDSELSNESFNFGPQANQNKTVEELVINFSHYWQGGKWISEIKKPRSSFHEAGLLKLNIDKAKAYLDWEPVLDFNQTIKLTSEWYELFYRNTQGDVLETSSLQIEEYLRIKKAKNIQW
jgi:CDP-glucose 4,6-dehydratase